eukprot:m.204036 g.204036  ORF g.204036 m.204036 type:complete len:298 (-) comp26016_c0_seq1:30-923(-)
MALRNSGPFAALVVIQICSFFAGCGILATGIIQIKDEATFDIDWCNANRSTSDCWTKNDNAAVAMTFYAVGLICFGTFAVLSELRIRITRPPGFLLLPSLLCLGAARNTGIVCGSVGMVMGLVQLLVWALTKERQGPLEFANSEFGRKSVLLIQFFCTLTTLATVAVGIMTIVSAVRDDTAEQDLKWCVKGEITDAGKTYDNCWVAHGPPTDFAIGCYGATLAITGLMLLLGNIKVAPSFLNTDWSWLGTSSMVVGVLTLGAVGNLGIIVGSVTVFFGMLQALASSNQKQSYDLIEG